MKIRLIINAYHPLGETQAANAPISVWRTLFVANEWNELQTLKRISIAFTVLWIAFFMRGLGLEYLATGQPNSKDLSSGPTNQVTLSF